MMFSASNQAVERTRARFTYLSFILRLRAHELQDPGLVSARLSALAKRRGFRVHLHQLRHTHASLLLRAGIPIPDVSARLGHSNPGVTMKTYAHAIPTEQGHTVAAIEKMLGG